MNKLHLELCASDEWAAMVEQHIIPWAIEGDWDLGDDVLEIGPGPGRTTDILSGLAPRITAVELDTPLADALRRRFVGKNVEVLNADATDLPLDAGRFSCVFSFTMLHHVPTPELQDTILAEVARVLRPGGMFAGVDSLDSPQFRSLHEDDICVPVPPETIEGRLAAAGFEQITVDTNPYSLRFRARKPAGS